MQSPSRGTSPPARISVFVQDWRSPSGSDRHGGMRHPIRRTTGWVRAPGWLVLIFMLLPSWRPPHLQSSAPLNEQDSTSPRVLDIEAEPGSGSQPRDLSEEIPSGLFIVEGEGARGPGILIDSSGLVMTTSILGPSLGFSDRRRSQLIEEAYVAVHVGPESKVRARLLADDPRFNVAVVWVGPEAVKGFEPLSLVRATEAGGQPPAAGDRLRILCPAIGQPAHHATGQIERVKNKTIILQTGLNPGFLGCPAVNARGEVVGFASDRIRIPMARLYRIEVARKALSEAREKVAQSQPPPLDPLPIASAVPYPEAALAKAASQRRDAVIYHAQSDRGVTLEFLTPPLIRSLAAGQDWPDEVHEGREILYQRDSGFFWWQRYAGRTDPVVIIQAVPPMRKDPGSVAWTITGWIFALPSCGQSLDSVDITYRFEPQFGQMILLKDGIRVAPIHPGRICSVFLVRMMKDPDDTAWRDMVLGCYGAYEYASDLFRPGVRLSVRVVPDDRTEAEDFDLSPQLIERIRSDFEPYDRESRPASSSEMSPGP